MSKTTIRMSGFFLKIRGNAVINTNAIVMGSIENWRYEPKSNPIIKHTVIGIKG